jgi:hypothetical protein
MYTNSAIENQRPLKMSGNVSTYLPHGIDSITPKPRLPFSSVSFNGIYSRRHADMMNSPRNNGRWKRYRAGAPFHISESRLSVSYASKTPPSHQLPGLNPVTQPTFQPLQLSAIYLHNRRNNNGLPLRSSPYPRPPNRNVLNA